jgi:hypothetical protein
VKTQGSMGKTNFFLGTLPCILAMWLNIEAPQKIEEKYAYNSF